MRSKTWIVVALLAVFLLFESTASESRASKTGSFKVEKDLLLAQFDCKTDVDDLHTVAAMVTLLSDARFSAVRYHAVAGTYGTQDGLYVPPNDLFRLAFGNNWSDAHEDFESAVEQVKGLIAATLENGGDIWIADAGQSDFSAAVVRALAADFSEATISERIHVVQHSNWNEEVTAPDNLQFVKENTDYNKIPDGNAVGNGTPGFRSPDYTGWSDKIKNAHLREVWQLAIELGNRYNGKDGRYLNEAVSAGGLDFSDLSEVCWILGVTELKNTADFFERYGK